MSNWRENQSKDTYFRLAKEQNYRSRAAFKLIDLQNKFSLLRPGNVVLDLGSAPGSWSQAAARILKGKAKIMAFDLSAMKEIVGVDFVQMDAHLLLNDPAPVKIEKIDVLLSDMAPSLSGIKVRDEAISMELVELALDISLRYRAEVLVVKFFQCKDFSDLLVQIRAKFNTIDIYKPAASHGSSREQYLIARNRKTS